MVVIDFGDMNLSYVIVIIVDFKKWVNSGCVSEIE